MDTILFPPTTRGIALFLNQ